MDNELILKLMVDEMNHCDILILIGIVKPKL